MPEGWRTPVASGDVLERFFAWHAGLRPVDATFIGDHAHDRRLPDWSPRGMEAWVDFCAGTREALAAEGLADAGSPAIDARDWRAIDGALVDSWLEVQLAEARSRHFTRGNPSLVIGEAAFAIIGLVTRDFAPALDRAASVGERLRAIPGFLAGALAGLGDHPVPALWRERALRECAALQRLLAEGLVCWCRAMAFRPPVADGIMKGAAVASLAVRSFEVDLRSRAAGAPVATCGRDMLELLVRRGHWCERPLDDLLREARERLAESRARLGEMAGAGGFAAVQGRLAGAHPTPGGYYDAFRRTWEACRSVAVAHDLVTWPDAPVRYVPIPAWTRVAAPSLYYLYYRSPAPLDRLDGTDYVVTPVDGLEGEALQAHLGAWNDSVIKLNHVVHHGALGHHVQNWFAARSPSRVGRVAASDCASRIAMFQAGTLAEGWACYATDLMDEVGFLADDERVAEQHTRVRMLARAVADIELHAGLRSFERTEALYIEEVGMSPQAARAEAVKNSMFPGTAMMYWLGTQGLHDLRAGTRARRGSRFALGRFHDELLGFGSLPVPVVSRLLGSVDVPL